MSESDRMTTTDPMKCLWGATSYDGARLVYFDDDGEQTLLTAARNAGNLALFNHIADMHNQWRIRGIDSIEEYIRVHDCEDELAAVEAKIVEVFGFPAERELWVDPECGTTDLHLNVMVDEIAPNRKVVHQVHEWMWAKEDYQPKYALIHVMLDLKPKTDQADTCGRTQG